MIFIYVYNDQQQEKGYYYDQNERIGTKNI